MIKRVIIHNYKIFQHFDLTLDDDLNIIVGDNESGKSTILEAINLALTKKINGRYLENELSPHLFNILTSTKYLEALANNENPCQPEIYIELYFIEDDNLTLFKGSNNSLRENAIGIRLEIIFDEDFNQEYKTLISGGDEIKFIPIEYYKVNWFSFADSGITSRSIPIGVSYIDTTSIRLQSGTDYYMQNIINSGLDVRERVALSVEYRKLKEKFANEEAISAINKKIDNDKGEITDKELAIAMDVSQKNNWETSIIPHLDQLPFLFSGKGEQNSLKIMLALKRNAEKTNVILVEEPENHLSFSSMNRLLHRIITNSAGKQVIVSTHSSFVLNKLGLVKLILIANGQSIRLNNLPPDTQEYFKKLSGYDTLRLILAKKAILVEGPSDELIVQKAYLNQNKRLPIMDGVDVINVRGLSFKRFLDIAKLLQIRVSVVTDNDGDYAAKITDKYAEYSGIETISIFADNDNSAPTLEPQIVKCNDLSVLNSIFTTTMKSKKEMEEYLEKKKVESALILFETKIPFTVPEYITHAIQ